MVDFIGAEFHFFIVVCPAAKIICSFFVGELAVHDTGLAPGQGFE